MVYIKSVQAISEVKLSNGGLIDWIIVVKVNSNNIKQ